MEREDTGDDEPDRDGDERARERGFDALLPDLARRGGRARIVSISHKDRGAILPAGRRADAVYWLDSETGRFVTSTCYRGRAHDWATAFNRSEPLPAQRWFGKDWERLRPDIDYARYSGADEVTGEGRGVHQGYTFPHAMKGGKDRPGKDYYQALQNSPFGNQLLLEFAERAIDAERLGNGPAPDLLCLSFSSNDAIGHTWGPDSQEVMDVTLRSDGASLYVKVNATGQEIKVVNHFATTNRGIERIEFADGSSWTLATINANAPIRGTTGNDTLNGSSGSDTIEGLGGNDTLNGNGGADTLVGGLGNDTLNGGTGADVYVYASGDGSDIIAESSPAANEVDVLRLTNLNAADVSLRRSGSDLFVKVNATGQEIRVVDHFYAPGYYYGIEKIEFADGSSWNLATINANAPIRGTTGNDTLNGFSTDDILFGDLGNDTLQGEVGSDVYVYRSGDGSDVIDDVKVVSGGYGSYSYGGAWNEVDVLRLSDLNASGVTLRRSDGDLYVRDNATGQDIRVVNQFAAAYWGIEKIEFADGSSWDLSAINANAWIRGTTGNDTLNGFSTDDTLFGDLGNDTLNGGSGNDVLIGGGGNDTLNGGSGNDTFVFHPGFGADTIIAFGDSGSHQDLIEISSSIFADFAAVQAASAQVGADVVITKSPADTITLKNYNLVNLGADDFRFV